MPGILGNWSLKEREWNKVCSLPPYSQQFYIGVIEPLIGIGPPITIYRIVNKTLNEHQPKILAILANTFEHNNSYIVNYKTFHSPSVKTDKIAS